MPIVARVQIDPARFVVQQQRGADVVVFAQGSWEDAERVADALRGVEGLASAVNGPVMAARDIFPPGDAGLWAIELRDAEELTVRGTLAKMPPI